MGDTPLVSSQTNDKQQHILLTKKEKEKKSSYAITVTTSYFLKFVVKDVTFWIKGLTKTTLTTGVKLRTFDSSTPPLYIHTHINIVGSLF